MWKPGITSGPAEQGYCSVKLVPQRSISGFYSAIEKGYYADENLEVTLNAGKASEINPLDEVLNGNAQLGISSSDSLIIAKSNNQNFVAIGAILATVP